MLRQRRRGTASAVSICGPEHQRRATPASHGGITLNSATGMISVAAGTSRDLHDRLPDLRETERGQLRQRDDHGGRGLRAWSSTRSTTRLLRSAGRWANRTSSTLSPTTRWTAPGLVPANVIATIVTRPRMRASRSTRATGIVSVAAGTPADTYTIVYLIRELEPAQLRRRHRDGRCRAAVIDAVDDNAGLPVDTANAIVGALNVLTGDTVNGDPASITTVDIRC